MSEYRALSLYQPWASLIGVGKIHETRSWATDYRGLLLIHAARKWNAGLCRMAFSHPFRSALGLADCLDVYLDRRGKNLLRVCKPPLPLGAVVAICRLSGCAETSRVVPASPFDRAFGDWSFGRWAWFLEDVRRLAEPVPCVGKQGLWIASSELVGQVEAALVVGVGVSQ